ncbi:MAG: hypothetical protein ACTSYD_01725 [Candidatus Heimdallarchaeaceae archaeon]
MSFINVLNIAFFVLSTIFILAFLVFASIALLSIKKKHKSFLGLMTTLFLFAVWTYYTHLAIFLENSYLTSVILPGLLTIVIIFAAIAVFATPYVVPKVRTILILYNVIKYGGIVLIGYVLHGLVSSPPTPVIVVNIVDNQTQIEIEPVFLSLLVVWSVLSIVLLFWSTKPLQKTRLKFVAKRAKISYNIAVACIAGGFVLYILDVILRDFTSVDILYTLTGGLSRNSILFGLAMLIRASLIDPTVLFSMLRLLSFYLENKKISIILSIFSEKGPEILFDYGFSNLKNQKREMLLNTYVINTMSAFGMGDRFIVGSAFFPVPFEPDASCICLTSWIKDESQTDPRFEGKSFVQLQIILPRHIDWLIYDRKAWEKEFKALLENVTSRELLEDKEFWLDFVLKTLKREAMQR